MSVDPLIAWWHFINHPPMLNAQTLSNTKEIIKRIIGRNHELD